VSVRIAIVGDLNPSHPSHRELEAARPMLGPDVETVWIGTTDPRVDHLAEMGVDGVWLAPGSPYADDTAALRVIRWAREYGIPFLGTCGGLQYAVIEFSRTVLGWHATHAEVDGPDASNAVAPLACSLQGQERTVTPVPGTRFANLVGGQPFVGTHYCDYGPTDQTLRALTHHGWVVEATAPDAPVEVLSLWNHPFFVLSLFQPQIGALAGRAPHPLLFAFVDVARQHARDREWSDAVSARESALAAADAEPRPYVHQMRGPRHRWWRPLLAALVGTLSWLLLLALLTTGFGLAGLIPDTIEGFATDAWASLYGNLVLAALIPATLLALWVGHRRSPWRVFSVAGRFRWGWALWCAAVVLPIWAVYLGASWVVFEQEVLPRPEQWVGLIVVSLLTTPLQAVGEEVAFRGGLVQSVGSWFRSPVVALVVSTVLSTAAFALAHGSLDPWILTELGSLAVFGCYLAWRTGGLEAVIVIHVVNNLLILVSGAVLGGLEESYVDGASTGSPVSAGMNLVVTAATTAVLVWLARRRGIAPAGWLTPARG
jgi:membrane protease YdiL (CAAX protease family)